MSSLQIIFQIVRLYEIILRREKCEREQNAESLQVEEEPTGFSSSQKKEKRKKEEPTAGFSSSQIRLQCRIVFAKQAGWSKKSIFLLALRVNNKLDFVLCSKNSRNLIVMLCIQSVSLGAVKEKVLSINNQTHACNSPLQHLKI